MTPSERKEIITKIATAAVACERLTGCPAGMISAQVILESGWLKSAPGNNALGIKDYHGSFGRQLLATMEWFTLGECAHFLSLGDNRTAQAAGDPRQSDGRRPYHVKDWFSTFATLGDCFSKRASMWDKGPYAKAAAAYRAGGTVEQLVRDIAPIYATAPNYAAIVLSLVNDPSIKAAIATARG